MTNTLASVSTRKDRLFVPLAQDPYEWFKSGKKLWELRRDRRQFTSKHVRPERLVELRLGYTDPISSLWGHITEVVHASSIPDFFDKIPFGLVIPAATNRHDAEKRASRILRVKPCENVRLIGFRVALHPPHLVATQY